jgi:hypothetical protein
MSPAATQQPVPPLVAALLFSWGPAWRQGNQLWFALLVAVVETSPSLLQIMAPSRGPTPSTDRSQNLATNGGTIAVLHADNISIAGHNPATLTITPSGTGSIFALASAYSGLISSSFDKSNSANSSSNLPDSGSSGSLSQANELVFGCMANAARPGVTISAGSGFTLRNTAGRQRIANEDQVVNSKAGIDATFSQVVSREWAAIVTTYK